jgi:hypothetical protein
MIYIASSWRRHKERVQSVAEKLRERGFQVYDFTDTSRRKHEGIVPEKYPEQFDPEKHNYQEYLNRPEWKNAVVENREALDNCVVVILLLPCGVDSHADWAYAIGRGASSIVVGHPDKGDRSQVHLWADVLVETDDEILPALDLLIQLGRVKVLVGTDA